jgi:hypothetical protein
MVSCECTVRTAHLLVGVVRIPSAWVRKDEDAGVRDAFLLKAQRHRTSAIGEQRAEDSDANERNHGRTMAPDLAP